MRVCPCDCSCVSSNVGHCWSVNRLRNRFTASTRNVSPAVFARDWISTTRHQWEARRNTYFSATGVMQYSACFCVWILMTLCSNCTFYVYILFLYLSFFVDAVIMCPAHAAFLYSAIHVASLWTIRGLVNLRKCSPKVREKIWLRRSMEIWFVKLAVH